MTLSTGMVKYTLTLRLVVIFPACVGYRIGVYFSVDGFKTSLTITTVELHPLSNKIQKFLNFALPLLVFIHTCRMGE